MENKNQSPKIHSIKWGKIKLADGTEYKDAKLFPGGAREWDWSETGTHHRPGIQPTDVEELINNNAQIIILSQGFYNRLQVCEETKQTLEKNNIQYFVLNTKEAVKKYNELRKQNTIGSLIHSTC
jgi:hypothetical protein